MKVLLPIILAFMLVIPNTNIAQIYPSSCSANDSIKTKYKADADILALSRIIKYNSNYKDSATIPSFWSDSVMNALMAVYNCTLPVRDTIISPFVHVLIGGDYHSVTELKMIVDSSQQWVKDIINGIHPNSNTNVEALLSKYKFNNYSYLQLLTTSYLTLISDSNYNHDAIGKEWLSINGVYGSFYPPHAENIRVGDGDYISVDSITDSFTILSYSIGWGDCPLGCTCRIIWRIKVHTPSCGVELLERIDRAGPYCYTSINQISKENITIAPNPFSDYIQVPEACIGMTYSICNIEGKELLNGKIDNSLLIATLNLTKGIYILKLTNAERIQYIRAVKTN